jgi:competence protein ComFB
MEIRNLMEEIVEQAVLETCEEEKRKGATHTTPECCTDVACFVLNRIPQQYISSSRGVAHGEKTINENPQLKIDIMALAHEGFKRIASIERSYYFKGEEVLQMQGPVFVFPVIKGRLIDCGDFSAAKNVEIHLKTTDGEPVKMLDHRWQNPFFLDEKIIGNYLFLPLPLSASQPGEERLFEFVLSVDAKGFEPFSHFCKIALSAKPSYDMALGSAPDYRLQDLYLLRR